MGTGPDSVVDPALSVYGVAGLRVAGRLGDPGHPVLQHPGPVIAIAERAADLIWSRPSIAGPFL